MADLETVHATLDHAGITGVGSVTITDAPCTADTSVAATSTYTDVTGCSASLAAGTYQALVTVNASTASADAHWVSLRITDGTTHYAVVRWLLFGTNVAGEDSTSFHSKKIVLGSTTTVKLQSASNVAHTIMRRTASNNASNIDSTIVSFTKIA